MNIIIPSKCIETKLANKLQGTFQLVIMNIVHSKFKYMFLAYLLTKEFYYMYIFHDIVAYVAQPE